MNIFISYRRDDSRNEAGRIRDGLKHRFKMRNVFMDVEDIQGGEPWRIKLEEKIREGGVFLAIIGDQWLGTLQKRAGSEDLVRQEIEIALDAGISIIPVLVGSVPVPNPQDLPPSINRLPDFNAMAVRSGSDFSTDMEKLARAIMTKRRLKTPRIVAIGALSLIAGLGLVAWGWSIYSPVPEAAVEPTLIPSDQAGPGNLPQGDTPPIRDVQTQKAIVPLVATGVPDDFTASAPSTVPIRPSSPKEESLKISGGSLRVVMDSEVKVGARAKLEITASQDVFICAVHISSDEFVTELFPGTTGQTSLLKSNETKLISWEVTPPGGVEQVIVYASPSPIQNNAIGIQESGDFKIVKKSAFYDTRGVPKAIQAVSKLPSDLPLPPLDEVKVDFLVKED
ncbi:MAG: TIR domain-containing protein [Verrucomicrobiales bacterium]|nr:TIR domain-containing protein [Verrucomicrobiales bacterium]